ncbi:MAG TPA: hypothetical protein VGR62_19880 [Candidatus Binatia bacterium]|jgi:hypothetical protein|nr:hypothetical protein [Candidatus Binatia bacterium]
MIVLALLAIPLGAGLAIATLQGVVHVAAARAARLRDDACAFDDPDEHTSTATWTRLGLTETLASVATAMATVVPSRVTGADVGRRSVVLVSGWAMPAGASTPLVRRLRRQGWARVYPLGLGAWSSLDDGARRLDDALATLRRTHDVGDVDVIAVGLGGLAVRALLRRDGRRARIRRVLTLGTPHQGTTACPWLRVGPWAADVRPGAAALQALDGDAMAPALDAVALASQHDVLLDPPALAYWPGAFNVTLREVGHLGQLFSARVWELVAENLAHAQDVATSGRSNVG